jgi:hypothetical protein
MARAKLKRSKLIWMWLAAHWRLVKKNGVGAYLIDQIMSLGVCLTATHRHHIAGVMVSEKGYLLAKETKGFCAVLRTP